MPNDLPDLRAGFAEDLAELVAPLQRRLANVDEWIGTHRAALEDLQALRREIVAALKPLVPEDAIPLAPGMKGKPGPKPRPPALQAGQAKRIATMQADAERRVDELLDYLRENYNGQPFTGTEVAKRRGTPGQQSQISKRLRRLHEREQIIVDHHGEHHAIYYRLV